MSALTRRDVSHRSVEVLRGSWEAIVEADIEEFGAAVDLLRDLYRVHAQEFRARKERDEVALNVIRRLIGLAV